MADMSRYMSPRMRARRSGAGGMTALTPDTPSETPNQAPERPADAAPEAATSIFVKASAFGGTPPKEGQSYTMTVKSVDPETGDAECEVSGAAQEAPAEEPTESREEAFDQRMPEESEEMT